MTVTVLAFSDSQVEPEAYENKLRSQNDLNSSPPKNSLAWFLIFHSRSFNLRIINNKTSLASVSQLNAR